VEGLSGLVSWWDAHGEERVPDAGSESAPGPTDRPVVRSSVDLRANAATGASEPRVDLDPSPSAGPSFRDELEALLLAEARASGIEVYA
jgi:hypothetical protein